MFINKLKKINLINLKKKILKNKINLMYQQKILKFENSNKLFNSIIWGYNPLFCFN
jgi:hypothetical protein